MGLNTLDSHGSRSASRMIPQASSYASRALEASDLGRRQTPLRATPQPTDLVSRRRLFRIDGSGNP